MTACYGEDALLLGKVKWVQHEIVSIPSKHALSSLPGAGGGQKGVASLADGNHFSFSDLFFCVFPIFHFPASPCHIVSKCMALVTLKLPSDSITSIDITCVLVCASAQFNNVETQFKTAAKSSQVINWLKSGSKFD